MKTLHIFNIDHDYALADGSHNYTPPIKIRKMRNLYSLFPALYAEKGDMILHLDSDANNLPEKDEDLNRSLKVFKNLIDLKQLKLVTLQELHNVDFSDTEIAPWGWNHTLIYKLLNNGTPANTLPMQVYLDRIRKLSHRSTSIIFFQKIMQHARQIKYALESETVLSAFKDLEQPIEIHEVDELWQLRDKYGLLYLKAPWSSSGRGVMYTKDLTDDQISQWVHGILKKQGSVIVEKAYSRKADFATEWALVNGQPVFLGFSTFETSPRGKFKVNKFGTLDQLDYMPLELITHNTHYNDFEASVILSRVVEAQIYAIKSVLSNSLQLPNHILYLGIDMLIGENDLINPCVEINLRSTMGHVALMVSEQISETTDLKLKNELLKFVAHNGIRLPEI